MVPHIAKNGRSFKGAMQYYLHDKKAETADRVAFVETLNLPTDDPDRAIAHMIDLAEHSDELKELAGFKPAKIKAKPVYSYSLSFHASETPTMAEQIEAARETIKKLGLQEHQAFIVGHNDTNHPHVHVIINRIHPETGIAAKHSNDWSKLQDWAREYQQARGQDFCPQREANYEARQRGEWVKYKGENDNSADHAWRKLESDKIWTAYRAECDAAKGERKAQFNTLWERRQELVSECKADIKELYKPHWRELYKRQRSELKTFDNSVTKRIKFAFNHYRQNKPLSILRAFTTDEVQRIDFLRSQEQERKNLVEKQSQTIFAAATEVTKLYQIEREKLREIHKHENDTRLEETKAKSDAVWKREPANDSLVAQSRLQNSFADRVKAKTDEKQIDEANREVRKRRRRTRKRDGTGRNFTPD